MIYRKGRELAATYRVGRAVLIIYQKGRLAWELISSTFLDRFGDVFRDKTGVPFMGKET